MILWNVTNKTKTAETDRTPDSIGFFNNNNLQEEKKGILAGTLTSIMHGP